LSRRSTILSCPLGSCPRPPSHSTSAIGANFQGAAKAFQNSPGNLWVLLAIAIMVVCIVAAF
jgi:hypothetical protein